MKVYSSEESGRIVAHENVHFSNGNYETRSSKLAPGLKCEILSCIWMERQLFTACSRLQWDCPNYVSRVFAKNSLIKNIFNEEKKFDSRTWFFSENSSVLGVFWPRRGLQANHGTVRKVQYSYNEAIKSG